MKIATLLHSMHPLEKRNRHLEHCISKINECNKSCNQIEIDSFKDEFISSYMRKHKNNH